QYKTTDYEGGTRTPMIAHWPGKIMQNSKTDHPGHLIDFMPTMLDLAGAKTDNTLPGQSLVPILQGKQMARQWPLYWQFGKSQAIRDKNWKLVKHASKDWELYDLESDPTETQNLAAKDPEKVTAMADRWKAWWEQKASKK
ncbi:sulfatase-like hydrolase/transferase, partial [Rubripirellula sp.]